MPTSPAAVLFDMDGTLVDTERLWLQAVAELPAELNHTLTDEDLPEVLGRAVDHTAAHLHRTTGMRLTADALAERLNDAQQ
ncbi:MULTISPECIES: HAD hydrolase-like protein [Streptomyces]|uniref:HAD hydrolase-like protein n=1 Tax=Streptomyces TaxID=1883 RepID=UPI0035DCC07F